MLCRDWNQFLDAGQDFAADPSPANEGKVISTYATWVRGFCPHDADAMIDLLCRRTAELVRGRSAA